MFPVLGDLDVARICPFGHSFRFQPSDLLVTAGKPVPGVFLILTGAVDVTHRDGLGHIVPLRRYGRGEFLGEIGALTGATALVDGQAIGEVEALLVVPDQLRAMIIAEADLGERLMRAMILRRVRLIESDASGPALIGNATAPNLMRLQNFLQRNAQPYHVIGAGEDDVGIQLLKQYGATVSDALVVCPDGTILLNPTDETLARALGMVDSEPRDRLYDVIVVGAGPAGLATAVYAASEGLSVVVLDCRSFGGQAGASARIENYLGFPTGISGQALAGRAYVQAQKFGAEMLIPAEAVHLQCSQANVSRELEVELKDNRKLRARCVVVASGAQYRRPDVLGVKEFEGRGIWYWASALEVTACRDSEVVLVGGGNSAGQAAVFLAQYVPKVYMLVRADTLASTMSQYLVDRIAATSNIELRFNSELTEIYGEVAKEVEGVIWRNRRTGEEERRSVQNVFIFIGAEPETKWMHGCGVAVDGSGFIWTGSRLDEGQASHRVESLETNVPGVYAVGDVRSGSVKRVGAAIGEGAAVVAQIHRRIATEDYKNRLQSSMQ